MSDGKTSTRSKRMNTLCLRCMLFSAPALLLAQGWDAMLGVSLQRRAAVPFGPATVGGSNQTSLGVRMARDRAPWGPDPEGRRQKDQWTLMLSTARNIECDEQAFALGYQRTYWDGGSFRLHGGIGAEVRGSRRIGKDFEAYYKVPASAPWGQPGSFYGFSTPVQLGGNTVWEARPVLRAFVGGRGILVPFSPFLLVWGRHPGPIHSVTRLEVALPLGRRGGDGSGGLLRQMAPGPEFTFSVGVRFNASS